MRQRIGLWLGPLLLLAILLLPRPEGLSSEAQRVGAVVAMMAIWWLLDAVPVAITALLPILLYPLLGVMKSSEVTPSYANHLIYLFLSGFLLALAIEKWGLHHRIALRTLAVMGHSPERVLLGFMLVTALLSMWMSATITAMMMLTVALALLHDEFGSAPSPYTERGRDQRAFATSLTLGIAYAASIGGAVTIVGSPPNAILAGILAQQHEMSLSLIGWMLMTLPVALVMLFGVWFYLSRIAY
ncbi:MAG TPA: SLC13 family permease, partial [Pseudomonadales bacterium]|nr:SLC13 family permease [Pseudomonadales bacterium]